MHIYVEADARRGGDGTKERPLRSLAQAAKLAVAGDEVIVAPGIYREYVDPVNAGTPDRRIVYRSAVKNGAVITGAEPVKNWEHWKGDVWVVRIPNGLFGDYNPYTTYVRGDWYNAIQPVHTGEVYLKDKSFYEAQSLEQVENPVIYKGSWDQEDTLYKWYTEQDGDTTVIYANFQGADPNQEDVEINVRRNCFYPSKTGVGYITLFGFKVTRAATQWAPPTAYQEGMIGPRWSKGWIIEDCEVSHSKCSGISLGMAGAEIGGIKLHAAIDVIIRRNHFERCTRGLWLDWQAQGTRVTQNLFHDNMPPEGTEITMPLALAEDIFVEVFHGPTLIDNNLLLSEAAGRLSTQGLAFVHNLIAGTFTYVGNGVDNGGKVFPTPRYTPYHVPHRTEVDGFMTILHGDARFYNNIFVQMPVRSLFTDYAKKVNAYELGLLNDICGTKPYDGYPKEEEYLARFTAQNYSIREERDKYYDHLPVYTGGNVYFNGAQPYDGEEDFVADTQHKVELALVHEADGWRLQTNLYDFLPEKTWQTISTQTLGMAFEPEERFENPDGTEIVFDTDYFGNHRGISPVCGPFEGAGAADEAVWS